MKRICTLLVTTILISIILFNSISAYAYAVYYDVFDDHWAYEAIQYTKDAKLFNGYEDGTFLPDKTITRAEGVKVLVAFLGLAKATSCPSFIDVYDTDWYAPYVEAGKNLLPATPVGGNFRPNDPITREDTIFAIVRAMELNLMVTYVDVQTLKVFADNGIISAETAPYLAAALQLSLVSGYNDGTLRPKNPLTRAEFATLLYRAVKLKQGKTSHMVSVEDHTNQVELTGGPVAELMAYDPSTFQAEVMRLVNEIRRNEGLTELTVNEKLSQVAQLKAEDMRDNDYFGQNSPTYGSTMDMISDVGVRYSRGAGANLARGSLTPEEVVEKWMSSKNQKLHILNRFYTQTGIGYVSEGNIWVQTFIG